MVSILVALESIFLRNDNAPIKKNIGERMAALIGSTVDERMEIIDNVSEIYDLRSKFLYHGHRINLEETETIENFMMYAWRSLHTLVVNTHDNPTMTKDQFFAAMDRRRLSY